MRENLIKTRQKFGLNQEEFAKHVKIERTKYNKIERSRINPSLNEAVEILKALKCKEIKEINTIFFDK